MVGTCTVIIPTYNEEKNIVNMARCLRGLYPDFHITFMDDNSTDRSKELIDALNDPKTRIVTRDPDDRGLAASVLQGIVESKTEYFMTIDCDFQHPPTVLEDMFKRMEEGCDLCIGVRSNRMALGLMRWAGSWAGDIFANVYLFCIGKRTTKDVMSGLIAGRTDMFIPVIRDNWDKLEMLGWKVLLDLLKFGPHDMEISKSYYVFEKRAEGESHISPRVIATTFKQCGPFGRLCAKVYCKLRDIEC